MNKITITISGPQGCGKTLLAKRIKELIKLGLIQFTYSKLTRVVIRTELSE